MNSPATRALDEPGSGNGSLGEPGPRRRWVTAKRGWLDFGCAAGAAGVVAALAAFLPRGYMVNDDDTITAFLRENTLAPYLEPLLSEALGRAYAAAPDLPWFGLWLYAVYAAALALLARVLIEAPEGAPRALRLTLFAGAAVVLVCVAAQVLRVTFTTAAITACGVALVAFAAEVLRAVEGGEEESPRRALMCGLLLAAGIATRTEALGAAGIAAGPLLAATGWRLLYARRGPPGRALVALVAPSVVVIALGLVVPQAREPQARRYLAFNAECNALQLRDAFVGLHRRAPEVLAAAGWDRRHYVRFENWLYLDDDWYSTERLRALRNTGGLPREFRAGPVAAQARRSSGHGFHLLTAALIVALGLAATGLAGPRALGLGVVHLAALGATAVVLQRWLRFPARVAVPMALTAAIAVWIATRADCRLTKWAGASALLRTHPARVGFAGLALAAALARLAPALVSAIQTPSPPACAEFERRLVARDPTLVVVHAQAACDRDPLRAAARPYPHISLDWDIFSVPFYRGLARIGISRGAELVPRMVGDQGIYVLAERRHVRELRGMVAEDAPGARLVEVDTAGPGPGTPVLLRTIAGAALRPSRSR